MTSDGFCYSESELDRTKPTQQDFDTAARVLRWMESHVHLFPEEWSQEPAHDSEILNGAANRCTVYADDIITQSGDAIERQIRRGVIIDSNE
jgi:hypothetical protein